MLMARKCSLRVFLDLDVTVERGKDNTTIKEHVSGSPIKKITAADTALIEVGDDFGFDGTFEEFI